MATAPRHGRQIAAARVILRFSMEELAKRCDLHKQSIAYNERKASGGRKNRLGVSSYAARKVAEAVQPLGVTFETRKDGFAVVFQSAPINEAS